MAEAIRRAATTFGWSAETVRDRRYRTRGKLARSGPERGEDVSGPSISRSEVIAELKRLRDARRPSNNPIVGLEIPADDVIAAGRVIRDCYHLSLEDACTVVASFANWPVGPIMIRLDEQLRSPDVASRGTDCDYGARDRARGRA
ncbi:MAG: hypothetical protein ABSA65_18085 [Acidimicrobiales bacterium]